MENYGDQFMSWLEEYNYTHCFFVPGGNVMYLLESASKFFECVPFIHEIGATIAAEYFNESNLNGKRAFVLVTAGPGLTNTVTGIASAWVESRELLVIGGQAKSTELSRGNFRQIGFQEFDGYGLCQSITKRSIRIENYVSKSEVLDLVSSSRKFRKGPVFIEFCLDVSTLSSNLDLEDSRVVTVADELDSNILDQIRTLILNAARPVIVLGGEVSRAMDLSVYKKMGFPLATTFNGADRISADYPVYVGRPGWYGSRWSNFLIQQSDLVIFVGSRIGLMQVGYNWKKFAPLAKVIQIYSDANEMEKGFPKVDIKIVSSADVFLEKLAAKMAEDELKLGEWRSFIELIRLNLSAAESEFDDENTYVNPIQFVQDLISNKITRNDVVIPCSSGEASFVGPMRVMLNQTGQTIVTSSAMASMGYGLAGAIGASLANRTRRTLLFEGDGGFAQNLQELGTVKANQLPLKIFLMNNGGYMSIKNNQKNSFNGHYIGCDSSTGLVLPDWAKISESFSIDYFEINKLTVNSPEFMEKFNSNQPTFFEIKVNPDQKYIPRISSTRQKDGSIESNALHQMEPELSHEEIEKYLRYLQ
jgi:acetolactate synthase-1/2/3 large subunit